MNYGYVVKRPYANFYNFLGLSLDRITVYGLNCANSHPLKENLGHEMF